MWIFHPFWEQFFLWKNFLRSGTIWLVTVFPCLNQEDNSRWVIFDNFLVFLKSYPIFEKLSIIVFKKYNYFLWVCWFFWSFFFGHFWHFFDLKKNHIQIDANKQFNNLRTTVDFRFKQIHLHKEVANFSRVWIHFIKSCLNQKLSI